MPTTAAMLKEICRVTGMTRDEAIRVAVEEYARARGISLEPPPKAPRKPRAAEPVAEKAAPRLFVHVSGLPAHEVLEKSAVLGSSRRCDVWVNMPHVETQHARVAVEDGEWVLEDLNSEAGTFHAGKRIKRRVLKDGDELSLAGFVSVRFEMR